MIVAPNKIMHPLTKYQTMYSVAAITGSIGNWSIAAWTLCAACPCPNAPRPITTPTTRKTNKDSLLNTSHLQRIQELQQRSASYSRPSPSATQQPSVLALTLVHRLSFYITPCAAKPDLASSCYGSRGSRRRNTKASALIRFTCALGISIIGCSCSTRRRHWKRLTHCENKSFQALSPPELLERELFLAAPGSDRCRQTGRLTRRDEDRRARPRRRSVAAGRQG